VLYLEFQRIFEGRSWVLTTAQIISIAVFVVVMALVVSEKIHRTIAALLGAVLLLCLGIIDFDIGMESIDFNTLGVLCGMMLFVACVKESGMFEYVAIKAAKICKGNPWKLMVAFCIITALFSALLDNVTTILLIGPMTIMLCRTLKIDATPFLIAEILSSNIGGTSTLIGDPPNIMIGSAAGYTFFDFIHYDFPVVVIIMVVMIFIFRFLYGRKLHVAEEDMQAVMQLEPKEQIKNVSLFRKSIVMIVLVTVFFMLHGALNLESSVIALAAAGIMLLISGVDLEKAIEGVEWSTIGFFLGLFMVVGAMEHTGVIELLGNGLVDLTGGNTVLLMIALLWGSAILSAILDNIPFVATMIPIIMVLEANGVDVHPLWWAISLGACLGGNGTLVGASANVVLSSIANKEGYPISFMKFTKVGFPIMLVSIIISTVYLLVIF
jgi:Na+/H+ antiporter NhaD/arsenite permease-like protein